jgi:hypothetical protein
MRAQAFSDIMPQSLGLLVCPGYGLVVQNTFLEAVGEPLAYTQQTLKVRASAGVGTSTDCDKHRR